jgi:transcriptional regulator with XRE-family HTH domain
MLSLSNIAFERNMICSALACHQIDMEEIDLDTTWGRLKWAREQAGYAEAADFARALQLNPITYRAYETGQNGFAKRAPDFAAKLGISSDWLMRGGQQPNVPISATPTIVSEVAPAPFPVVAPQLAKLPLWGGALGVREFDPDQHVELTELDMSDVLEYIDRPASLAHDRNAYCVSVIGDSMMPRFRPGKRLYVSTRATPAIGDDVIVQLRGNGTDTATYRDRVTSVLIKELVRRSATFIELKQYTPEMTFRVSMDQVAAMHKVLGPVPE